MNIVYISAKPPNLPDLLHLGITQKISTTNYTSFGILLLDDLTGGRVKTMKKENDNIAHEVVLCILQEWLEGKGLPVTWQTLEKTLRDDNIKLNTLADEIANLY